VRLAGEVRRAILHHADESAPRECCGFVIGTPRRVIAAVRMDNIAPGLDRFRISDEAHIALRRDLRRMQPRLVIMGVYHSHPAGRPWPSPTDIREAAYPEWLYLIAGLGHGARRLRGFRICNGRVRPIGLG
jgi:proteasome lid subunit RPN8/RPN11